MSYTPGGGGSYTDEQAQDAVGAMVATTATVALTYTDATPELKADVVAGSIGPTQLANTAVTPGTYGDATHAPQITVDADGRVTAASDVAIAASGASPSDTHAWQPVGALVGGVPESLFDSLGNHVMAYGPL